MKTKVLLPAILLAFCAFPALAAEKCYKTVDVAEKLTCAATDSRSADFAEGCQIDGGGTEEVEIPCAKGRWVNVTINTWDSPSNLWTNQQAQCEKKGMNASTYQGYRCASGRFRPSEGPGAGSINYKYGKKGSGEGGTGGSELTADSRYLGGPSVGGDWEHGGKPGMPGGSAMQYSAFCAKGTMNFNRGADQYDAMVAVYCE